MKCECGQYMHMDIERGRNSVIITFKCFECDIWKYASVEYMDFEDISDEMEDK